jgi:D-alanyl-D-alanine carboxypeptidase
MTNAMHPRPTTSSGSRPRRERLASRLCGALVVGAVVMTACGTTTTASGSISTAAAPATPPGTANSTGNGPLDGPTLGKVQEAVDRFKATNQTPGALIGIWSPNGTYVTATGVADLSTGAPLEPDMQFKIASQTKTFTANLVLQLVSEGDVSLDDHIDRWIAGVPNGNQITIRQLLNHTSGLADGFTSPTIQGKVTTGCTVDELLTAEALFPPVAAPGTTWSYSNYGYNLLGRVVELVTGQDLSTALQTRIAEPLGLHRTLLPTTGNGLTPPFTHGYGTGEVGPTQAPPASDDATDLGGSCLWAHGGMVSTLADMHIWAKALATGALIDPKVWASAQNDMVPFVFSGNYNGPGRWTYGLGFVETGGFIGGEGSFAGYESAAMYSPALDTTIVVVSTKLPNAITPPPMIQALAMAIYGNDVDFGLTTAQALEPNTFGSGHE